MRRFTGSEAARLGGYWWDVAPERYREPILWNVQMAERRGAFREAIGRAAEVFVWEDAGIPVLIVWIEAVARKGKTGFMHLFPAQSMDAEDAISLWEEFGAATGMDYLLGLVPAPYRGVKRLAETLGFTLLASLPKACFLAERGTISDGCLYGRSLETWMNADEWRSMRGRQGRPWRGGGKRIFPRSWPCRRDRG